MGAQVRRECCFARCGGEAFAVVLPETSLAKARVVAERFRGSVETHEFRVDGALIPVTVSADIAVNHPDMAGAVDFFHAADRCLYEAKHQGRNRVAG